MPNSWNITTVFTHTIIVLLLTLTPFTTVFAQNEGRSYQVEVLIFKRNTIDPVSDEIWRQDLDLAYPENTTYISNSVSKNQHQLGGHNYTLRKSEQYTVLFHQAWRQKMWEKEKSPWLIIRGGRDFGEHRELEGTIRIHIGRYLHVTTDLWLSDYTLPTSTAGININSNTMRIPPIPFAANRDNALNGLGQSLATPTQVVTFREKRRMRSKETHYIDHPLMGIMVRMLPLD